MSLDDLRNQQKKALESEAAWKSLSKDLESKFKAELASLGAEIKNKTGLEVKANAGKRQPSFFSEVDSMSIRSTDELNPSWLILNFPGLNKEINIESLAVTFWSDAQGSWLTEVRRRRSEQPDLKYVVTLSQPCIPLRIGLKRNLWWCGPGDNDKIIEAIVDELSERDKPSDFSLKEAAWGDSVYSRARPKPSTGGCAFLLTMSLAILLLTLALLPV